MKEVYLLSGLGADRRVFDAVDLSGFKTNHVTWVDPEGNESLEHYAKRLLGQIKTQRPILIGVSFGGMMAIEIAKLLETEKVVVISSVKTGLELPWYFRMAGFLRLHKLIPIALFKSVNKATYWLFGTTLQQERELLKVIVRETDPKFLAWAIDKIVTWRNTTLLPNLIHIHGTNDRILPAQSPDQAISNAGHWMIVNKGKEISGLIRQLLR